MPGMEASRTPEMVSSYFLLFLRVYHVWCMAVGLFMALALLMQVALTIYVDLMSTRWAAQAPQVPLLAACLDSVLLLVAGTQLCYSAVWLMLDAWQEESFLAFRSLCGKPYGRRGQVVQLIICAALDVVPVLAGLWGSSACFGALALTCLLQVLIFWFLELLHDIRCKLKALRCLRSPPPLLAAPRHTPGDQGPLQELRQQLLRKPWTLLLVLLFLLLCSAFAGTTVLWLVTLAALGFAASHVYRCWARNTWSSIRVVLSEELREQLLQSLGEDLVLCQALPEVPVNYQLVNDGRLFEGELSSGLQSYPLGSVLRFRREVLGRWGRFLESFCGGTAQQIFEVGVVVLLVGLLCCTSLFQVGYVGTGIFCMLLLMIQVSPALCAVFQPLLAPYVHGMVSLTCGFATFLLGFAAPSDTLTFWLVPSLVVATQFLLLRRPAPYFRAVSVSIMLLVALLLALFLWLSIASALQPPPSAPQPASRNFTFTGPVVNSLECDLSFPTSHPSKYLSLADFGFLNSAAYEPEGLLEAELERFMGEWQVMRSHRHEEHLGSADWSTWFALSGRPGTGLENTTVLAIRGTKTTLEMIFDLDLWSLQILGIQNFADHFPGIGFPFDAFWNSPSLGRLWFRSKRERYRSVLDYLTRLQAEEPWRRIYVSGHSLGGGLAQLAAAELDLPAVTLSSPGVVETAGLLGLAGPKLQRTMNVIPDTDPIPANGGTQGGLTVPIPCLGTGPECHRVFNTICMLLRLCGDPRRRPIPCDFCPEARRHAECA